ncbi:MAG: hypothetical protein LUF28_06020 [Clostridiales bacterium]|nr:hypothetical protein [Clostridiales bacterium]
MTSTRSYPKQPSATGIAFRWHWRKNRLLLLLYALLLVVALPGCFFLNLLNNTAYYLSSDYFVNMVFAVKEVYLAKEMTSYLTQTITYLVIPIAAVFAFLMAHSSFSYLHSRRATDLYAALPIRRTPMLMGASWPTCSSCSCLWRRPWGWCRPSAGGMATWCIPSPAL